MKLIETVLIISNFMLMGIIGIYGLFDRNN